MFRGIMLNYIIENLIKVVWITTRQTPTNFLKTIKLTALPINFKTQLGTTVSDHRDSVGYENRESNLPSADSADC